MLYEGEIVNGDNLAYFSINGWQNEIRAMIDIYLTSEKGCVER